MLNRQNARTPEEGMEIRVSLGAPRASEVPLAQRNDEPQRRETGQLDDGCRVSLMCPVQFSSPMCPLCTRRGRSRRATPNLSLLPSFGVLAFWRLIPLPRPRRRRLLMDGAATPEAVLRLAQSFDETPP